MTRGCVALMLAALLLAGCARTVVVEPGQAPTPYDGPLVISTKQARTAIEKEAGAAGRAVQCRGKPTGGRNMASGYGGEVGSTPTKGLHEAVDEGSISGPPEGWQQDRTEGDRALFTVTVDGKRRAAVVMHRAAVNGNQVGWYAETYAYCNIAEFPPEVATDLDTEIWTDAAGRRVDTRTITSFPGAKHCNWEAMTFLNLNGGDLDGPPGTTYVGRAQDNLVGDYFAEPYRKEVPLPADAIDSGYALKGRHLWLSADRNRAYVGKPGAATVELWPRTIQPLGCA